MNKPFIAALGCAAVIVGLLSVSSVSTAVAAPAPTPVARSTPDFSSMMFLTGTWNCTQQLRGKARPDTSTTTVGMDGMWMVSQDTAPPFDQYRTWPVNITTYTGYDPTIKQWVAMGVGNDGTYFMSSSPGWQGNTITWTSKGLDGGSVTDVGTKVSDTETSDAITFTDAKGKATNIATSCKKSGS
jgi:hypothetical protein